MVNSLRNSSLSKRKLGRLGFERWSQLVMANAWLSVYHLVFGNDSECRSGGWCFRRDEKGHQKPCLPWSSVQSGMKANPLETKTKTRLSTAHNSEVASHGTRRAVIVGWSVVLSLPFFRPPVDAVLPDICPSLLAQSDSWGLVVPKNPF